jgi:hypothetical protein
LSPDGVIQHLAPAQLRGGRPGSQRRGCFHPVSKLRGSRFRSRGRLNLAEHARSRTNREMRRLPLERNSPQVAGAAGRRRAAGLGTGLRARAWEWRSRSDSTCPRFASSPNMAT